MEQTTKYYYLSCNEFSQTIKLGLGVEFIYPFIVLSFATILRKVLRHYHVSLPYTVVLMLVGAVLGAFYQHEFIKQFTFIADLSPVQILAIFLPILIFESAFSCDPHIFIKCLGQILTLTILGFFISVALTTFAVMYWYENEQTNKNQICWTWDQAILYSAVVSATDPVSVVSLLKSMTSLKTLSTVIEGESLLNDAAAITIFTLIKDLISETVKLNESSIQNVRTTLLGVNSERCSKAIRFLIKRKITIIYLLKFVLKTIASAILIGYIMAHITIFILYRIDAGELETCITISMSYFVYLACEIIHASGVIGVVLFALTLNINRACFSVSAIEISEQTWQLLAYVANSLIFITVGVILLKTYSENNEMLSLLSSLPQLVLVYIILTIVRGLMMLCIHFILRRIAYGFTWKDSIVTIWSGLRGSVSLVLSLTLFNSEIKYYYQAEILLIHTIAIVFFTCTVNALTIPIIIDLLRLNQTSELVKQTMNQILKELKLKQNEMIRHLKRNSILSTADWLFVQRTIDIQSAIDENKDDPLKTHIDVVKCEHCQSIVTVPISKYQFKQTFEDCRIRILRLQKTHFWLDYYNGQLSSYGLHTLNSLCDQAIDAQKKLIDLDTIKSHIVGKSRLQSLLNIIRNWTRQSQKYFPWYYIHNSNHSNLCVNLLIKFFYHLPISLCIIIIELIILIYQFQCKICEKFIRLHLILESILFVLLLLDSIRLYYWFISLKQSQKYKILMGIWIAIYLFSITCRFISCNIFFVLLTNPTSKYLCQIFFIFKYLSFVQSIFFFLYLLEPLRLFLNHILNRYISISYDIGLAYISSEEQILRIINRLTDNETIRIRVRELSLQHIKSILNDVLLIQESHPGTIISIKTHHVLNLLYNTAKQAVSDIRSRGVLDVDDCNLLDLTLKNMHVYIHIPSTMPTVSPLNVIRCLSWLVSNEQLTDTQRIEIEYILTRELSDENDRYINYQPVIYPKNFSWQDFLWHKNDTIQGVYLLVNGIIEEWKLDPYDIDAHQSESRWKDNNRNRQITIQNFLNRNNSNHDLSNNIIETKNFLPNGGDEETTNIVNHNRIQSSKNITISETNNDVSICTTHVPIRFEEGFYMRWYKLILNPMDNKFKDHLTKIDENNIYQHCHSKKLEENFDETFDKYCDMHPATSGRTHRRYSYHSGNCIGLYDLLFNTGDKHETTAKCLTNTTVFFVSKNKLISILNKYSLWNILWLEMSIRLALRILPNISIFQYFSTSYREKTRHSVDFISIDKRLRNCGLIIFNEITLRSDDIIQMDEDILLVYGTVRNVVTKCIYEAPIFIESSLTKQGLKLLDTHATTKILALPNLVTPSYKNNIFTDSLLIEHILENEIKHYSNRQFDHINHIKHRLTRFNV